LSDLARRGAEIFTRTAKDSVAMQGFFSVAISGGSTPRRMHKMLVKHPYLAGIPWEKTHVFWADERMVPFSHPDSNYGTAKRDFLEKTPIPPAQIHPMPAWSSPETAATLYQKELERFFQLEKDKVPIFDLIFLGIGIDGHTASLFPGAKISDDRGPWLASVKGGNPNVNRLTMTYPIINQSRHVIFLVSGKEKAEVVKAIFEDKKAGLPAQRVQPKNGELSWLLDREAASLLP